MRGIDLRDLFTGCMSWRRFGVLVRNLPADSAYLTAVRDTTPEAPASPGGADRFGPWSLEHYFLASVIDGLNRLAWMQGPEGQPAPPPVPRPKRPPSAEVVALNAKARAYMAYVAEHHGEAPPEGWAPDLESGVT